MKVIKQLITALLLMLPFSTMAHGYWIELEGSHRVKETVTVKLFFGEYISGEKLSGNTLDKMKDIRIFVLVPGGKPEPVLMQQLAGHWEGKFTPATEGTYEINGINDTRDVQDWTKHDLGIVRPVQYLKALYQAGALTTKPGLAALIDIRIKPAGDGYELDALKDDTALAGAKLTITGFADDEIVLTTSTVGKTYWKTPKAGQYLLSIEWIDQTPGEFRGKPYATVRHRLDYTFVQP